MFSLIDHNMSSAKSITTMCQYILSKTDIKAIIKHRGFHQDANDRVVFESFFLSETGLNDVFSSLTYQEISLLHLLKMEPGAVNVRFFEAIYGADKPQQYGTFTQRYSELFKTVQKKLLRKGILLISEGYAETRLERWRFELPIEFAALLPPLIPASLSSADQKGSNRQSLEEQEHGLRDKLLAITGNKARGAIGAKHSPFSLKENRLCFNDQLFTSKALFSWQQKQWFQSLWLSDKKTFPQKKDEYNSSLGEKLVPLLYDALSSMAPGSSASAKWFQAADLKTLLAIYFYGFACPDAKLVCETGIQCGLLVRYKEQEQCYYRLAPAEQTLEPETYLNVVQDGSVLIDFKTVPFSTLEQLAMIALFVPDDQQIKLLPDMIHLGEASDSMVNNPVVIWLKQHSKSFAQALTLREQQQGKHCLHDNLCIAKVTDLSLRIQIQKQFSTMPPNAQVVMLAGDFIAFPVQHKEKIKNLVSKSGFAVKTVTAG